jgi:citrate lyase gamma subunit
MALSLSAAVTAPGGGNFADSVRAELVRQVVPQFTEAVRAAVIDGIRTRQIHLAQLAVIDRAAFQGHKLTALQQRIDDELVRTGLLRVTDTKDLALFNLLDSEAVADHGDAAPVYSVVAPAYVDQESGRTVERGWLSVSYDQPADSGPTPQRPSQRRRDHSRRRPATPPEQTAVLSAAAPGARQQKKKPRKGSQPAPPRSSGAVPAEQPPVHTSSAATPPGFRLTVQKGAVQSARAKFGSKETR